MLLLSASEATRQEEHDQHDHENASETETTGSERRTTKKATAKRAEDEQYQDDGDDRHGMKHSEAWASAFLAECWKAKRRSVQW
jgi:hypothetical protein